MLASGKNRILISTVTIRMATPKLPTLVVDPVDRQEHRLGDEVEPAPVDQQLEAVELQRVVVAVDDRDFLGAGEQPRSAAPVAPGAMVCGGAR